MALQKDLDDLVSWSFMFININKSFDMSTSKASKSIATSYNLLNVELTSVNESLDLGVVLDLLFSVPL